MARGINKVILIGHLGADPETRYTPNGNAATTIRLATSEQWTDKQSGEKREATEWHRVVLWRRLGEIAAEYLRKGSKVYIEGRLQTRKWQAQDGSDRYSTEIVANDMQMLDGPTGRTGNDAPGQPPASTGPAGGDSDPPADFDDDIPFIYAPGPAQWGRP